LKNYYSNWLCYACQNSINDNLHFQPKSGSMTVFTPWLCNFSIQFLVTEHAYLIKQTIWNGLNLKWFWLLCSTNMRNLNKKLIHLSNRGLKEETNTIPGNNGKITFWKEERCNTPTRVWHSQVLDLHTCENLPAQELFFYNNNNIKLMKLWQNISDQREWIWSLPQLHGGRYRNTDFIFFRNAEILPIFFS
jgi:hypothetical protein